MGSRGLLLFKGVERFPFPKQPLKLIDFNSKSIFSKPLILRNNDWVRRNCSSFTKTSANLQSSLEPPDVTRLAKTARITLTPQEVEEFAPKISQVIDWFGQLQAVDLRSVEPSIRTDTEGDNLRDDIPEAFENSVNLFFYWDPIIAEVPNYEEPFIKVPKVLNKES